MGAHDDATITLRSLIVGGLDAGMDPDDAATAALASCERDDLASLMLPAAELMARGIARQRTRQAEDDAFAVAEEETGASVRTAPVPVVEAARNRLISESFALPNGTWVAWSKATAAEHLMRADWQRKHAASSLEDAQRHEAAAEAIKAAGVTCLAEIGSAKCDATPKRRPRSRENTELPQAVLGPTPKMASPGAKSRGKTMDLSTPSEASSSRAKKVLS